jgi:hypothetical protein
VGALLYSCVPHFQTLLRFYVLVAFCRFIAGILGLVQNSAHYRLQTKEVDPMKRLGGFVKGYTLGTLFVLLHVATYELRLHRAGMIAP